MGFWFSNRIWWYFLGERSYEEKLIIFLGDFFQFSVMLNIYICRFVPGVRVVRPWMMIFCILGILASWYAGGLFMKFIYDALTG